MQDVGGFKIELYCNVGLNPLVKQLTDALPDLDWIGRFGDYKDNHISIEELDIDVDPYYYKIYVTINNNEMFPADETALNHQVELAKELKSVFEQIGCNPEVTLFFSLPDGTKPSI